MTIISNSKPDSMGIRRIDNIHKTVHIHVDSLLVLDRKIEGVKVRQFGDGGCTNIFVSKGLLKQFRD